MIINRQREMLANLEQDGELPPITAASDDAGSVPSAAQPQGVPGQEPPAAQAPGATPSAPPVEQPPQPQTGTADEALKQANTELTRQVEEYKTLYARQNGMVAPLQRQNAELQRTVDELKRQVEGLATSHTSATTALAPQATPPAQAGTAENPTLKEFMELYGEMVPGLKVFIQEAVGATVQQVQPAIELAKRTERQEVLSNHLAPLYVKHPNAAAIIRSPQFAQWVEQQPSFAKDSIYEIVSNPENFPVAQVIAIFDEHARSLTPQPPPPALQAEPSPGEMVVDVRRVPTSSTPGGTPLPQPMTRGRLTEINRALTVDRQLYTEAEIAAFKAEMEAGQAVANANGFGLAPRLETLSQR